MAGARTFQAGGTALEVSGVGHSFGSVWALESVSLAVAIGEWRLRESSVALYRIAMANPFTHAVELIRFALYGKLAPVSLGVVVGCTLVFGALALWAHDPEKGSLGRRPGGPGLR